MFKVGQKVRVIANNSYHEFEIGETVRVRTLLKNGEVESAECLDSSEYWFIEEEDIQPVDEEVSQ